MSFANKMNYYLRGLQERSKYLYSKEETEQFEKYIKDNVGNFEMVYHELYSPDVHLDILVIPPSKDRNYYTLITEGLGAYQMNVPSFLEEYDLDRAELVAYLPPEWNMSFESEEYSWIIEQLKLVARTPIVENYWIGFGHDFAQDENASKPYSDKTKFSSIVLLNSLDKNFECLSIDLQNKGTINFYQLMPLYQEEYEYKKLHGIEELGKLFPSEDQYLIIDSNRKNYCDGINKNIIQNDLEEEIERE